MLFQIFLASQLKRSSIIGTKHGIYELSHELPIDLRLWILVPHGIFADGGGRRGGLSVHTRKKKDFGS